MITFTPLGRNVTCHVLAGVHRALGEQA